MSDKSRYCLWNTIQKYDKDAFSRHVPSVLLTLEKTLGMDSDRLPQRPESDLRRAEHALHLIENPETLRSGSCEAQTVEYQAGARLKCAKGVKCVGPAVVRVLNRLKRKRRQGLYGLPTVITFHRVSTGKVSP